MKKERGVFVYVAPEFRSRLKVESAIQNCSMVELTRKLAKKNEEVLDNDERRKKPFTFRL